MPLVPSWRRPSEQTSLGNHEARIRALERRVWRQRMPYVNLRVNLAGVTIVTGEQQLEFNSFLGAPINHGGDIDTNVFSLDGGLGGAPWDHINILQPGVYWGEARAGWWQDWGRAGMNLNLSHTDSDFSVSDSYGYTASLPSEFGAIYPGDPSTANQTAVARRGFIMVDEYAVDVQVYATLDNAGGSSRTPNGRTMGAQLFLIQLAGSGHSNPP